jgi:hypothetical protein
MPFRRPLNEHRSSNIFKSHRAPAEHLSCRWDASFRYAIALVYGDAVEKQRRLAADRCPSCELNVRRADKKSSFGI